VRRVRSVPKDPLFFRDQFQKTPFFCIGQLHKTPCSGPRVAHTRPKSGRVPPPGASNRQSRASNHHTARTKTPIITIVITFSHRTYIKLALFNSAVIEIKEFWVSYIDLYKFGQTIVQDLLFMKISKMMHITTPCRIELVMLKTLTKCSQFFCSIMKLPVSLQIKKCPFEPQ